MAYDPPVGVYGPTAQTATGVSGAILSPVANEIHLIADITAVSGTTPTLTLGIEWSHDGGTTWGAGDPASSQQFTQFTAAATSAKTFNVRGTLYRITWVIGGTTPSFTIALSQYTTN